MAYRRKNKRYKKTTKITTSIIVILLLLLSCGLVYYFVFYNKNSESNNSNNKPLVDKPITESIYSNNDHDGFIIKNYSLIEQNILDQPNLSLYDNNIYKYIRYSVSDHNPIGLNIVDDSNNVYKLGHWNSLNFNMLKTEANDKQKEHAKNIAQVITYFKFDLIGLTEINKDVITNSNKTKQDNPAFNFVNMINDFVPESRKDQYHYDLIVSNNTTSKIASSGQSEQVAIIYNSKRIKPIELDQKENDALIGNGIFYSNPLIEFEGKQRDYVRAPFGSKFTLLDSKQNEEFGITFSHFDSPGSNDAIDGGLNKDNIGKQELFEAKYIDDVLEEFKTSLKTDNIIFMGDTNIKTKSQNKAFEVDKLSNLKYTFSFEDDQYHNTSLATDATVAKYPNDQLKWYANAYDKIIYNLNTLKTIKGQ